MSDYIDDKAKQFEDEYEKLKCDDYMFRIDPP